MKKKLLFIPILFVSVLLCSAQKGTIHEDNITLGQPYRVVDALKKLYFHKGNEILTIKIDKDKFIIQKLNAQSLSLISLKEYNDFPKEFYLEDVLEYKEKYYVLYALWDTKNKKEQLFYREIDFASGGFLDDGNLLLEIESKLVGATRRSNVRVSQMSVDKFEFFTSADDSKLLIRYKKKPQTKRDAEDSEIIGVSVFDGKMNPIWSRDITLTTPKKKTSILNYLIDSEGNVYIHTEVEGGDSTGKTSDLLEFLNIVRDGEEIRSINIDLMVDIARDFQLFESDNGHIIFAGFYANEAPTNTIYGQFVAKINRNDQSIDLKKYEIPEKVVSQFTTPKRKRKNGKFKPEFSLMSIQMIDKATDGSLLIIAEQDYQSVETTLGQKASLAYYRDDILITKIDHEGKLQWVNKLPKRQSGWKPLYDIGGSYEYFYTGVDHYLLFMDNVEHIDLEVNEPPVEFQHGERSDFMLCAYVVNDQTGKVERKELFDIKNVKGREIFQFSIRRLVPISPNEFVFEVYKKNKEDILVKVNLIP